MTRARTSPGAVWAGDADTSSPWAFVTVLATSCTCWSKCSTICAGADATTEPAAGSVRSRFAWASAVAGKAAARRSATGTAKRFSGAS